MVFEHKIDNRNKWCFHNSILLAYMVLMLLAHMELMVH